MTPLGEGPHAPNRHIVHKYGVALHDAVKKYRRDMKDYWKRGGLKAAATLTADIDNFQDPQLASLRPLVRVLGLHS